MRPNETKRRLAAGQPAIGCLLTTASTLIAEAVGGLGFDWVLADLQHGESNLDNLSQVLQAVSATAATPFARVPVNDPMYIGRALDLGAYGLAVPLINTLAQAEAAVRAAKYPPRGARSWGPIRGALYGGSGYFQEADRETLLFVMLETAEAVGNARAILAVDGVDGCYIGPNDLGISYGHAPGTPMAPAVEEALEAVLDAARVTGKVAGLHVPDAATANRRLRQGFRFVSINGDLALLNAAIGREMAIAGR